MRTKNVMKLVDPENGRMECTVCGCVKYPATKEGGGFFRGAWQCPNGCKKE